MITKRSTSGRIQQFYLNEDHKPFIAQQEAEHDIRQILRCNSNITRRSHKSPAA